MNTKTNNFSILKILSIFLTLIFLASPLGANAQDTKNNIKTNAKAFGVEKCQEYKAKWVSKSTTFRDKQNETQANLYTKFEDISTKLKAEGKDTTKLNTDLANLKMYIESANSSNKAVAVAVESLSCVDKLTHQTTSKAIRSAQAKANADNKVIKNFAKNIIKPEITKIKK